MSAALVRGWVVWGIELGTDHAGYIDATGAVPHEIERANVMPPEAARGWTTEYGSRYPSWCFICGPDPLGRTCAVNCGAEAGGSGQ